MYIFPRVIKYDLCDISRLCVISRTIDFSFHFFKLSLRQSIYAFKHIPWETNFWCQRLSYKLFFGQINIKCGFILLAFNPRIAINWTTFASQSRFPLNLHQNDYNGEIRGFFVLFLELGLVGICSWIKVKNTLKDDTCMGWLMEKYEPQCISNNNRLHIQWWGLRIDITWYGVLNLHRTKTGKGWPRMHKQWQRIGYVSKQSCEIRTSACSNFTFPNLLQFSEK